MESVPYRCHTWWTDAFIYGHLCDVVVIISVWYKELGIVSPVWIRTFHILKTTYVFHVGAGMTVKLLFNIISSIFDYNPNVATCMKPEMWQEWVKTITFFAFWIWVLYVWGTIFARNTTHMAKIKIQLSLRAAKCRWQYTKH